MKSRGYRNSRNDHSLFHKKTEDQVAFLVMHIDDILIAGNDESKVLNLKQFLHKEFKIKDPGLLHYSLGIDAIRDGDNLILTQRKFTADLLEEYN